MPITFPSTASDITTGSGISGTSFISNKPANIADNDVLVAVVLDQVAGSTISAPAGWTAQYTSVAVGTRGCTIFTKSIPTASAETATNYTFTGSPGGRWVCIIFRMVGAKSTPLDAAPTIDIYGSNATTIIDPSVTSVSSTAMVLAVNFANGTGGVTYTMTAPGFTQLANANCNNAGSTSTLNVSYKQLVASGATGTITQTLSASAASYGGFQITFAVAVSAPLIVKWNNGTSLVDMYIKSWDGTTLKDLAKFIPLYPGRKIDQFFNPALRPPVLAHRLGSANWREHTLRGATQSAIAGVQGLEISVARSSDGVFFGLHDADLNRTTPSLGGTSYLASAHTWAEISALSQTAPVGTDSVWGNINFPYQRVTDILDAYEKDFTVFIDPKVIGLTYTSDLITLLKTYSDWQNTFVGKSFHTATSTADLFHAAGMTTWGYAYANDVDGTSGGTQLSATASHWDWLSQDATASSSIWSQTLTIASGKPVICDAVATWSLANTALGYGAKGIMASGVNEVMIGMATMAFA